MIPSVRFLFALHIYLEEGSMRVKVPVLKRWLGYMSTIRIYNDPKDKRRQIRQIVQDFQEYEDISDFKASLFELKKYYFTKNVSLQDEKLHWRKEPKMVCEYLPTSIRCI